MTIIGALRPTDPAKVVARAASAMGETYAFSHDDRQVLEFAPPMPVGFWGDVVYRFQDGKLVNAEVRKTLKP